MRLAQARLRTQKKANHAVDVVCSMKMTTVSGSLKTGSNALVDGNSINTGLASTDTDSLFNR